MYGNAIAIYCKYIKIGWDAQWVGAGLENIDSGIKMVGEPAPTVRWEN